MLLTPNAVTAPHSSRNAATTSPPFISGLSINNGRVVSLASGHSHLAAQPWPVCGSVRDGALVGAGPNSPETLRFAMISLMREVDSLSSELQLSAILPVMNNGYRDGTARHRIFCSRRQANASRTCSGNPWPQSTGPQQESETA